MGNICPSDFSFQITNNKGADQTDCVDMQAGLRVCCSQATWSEGFLRRGPYDDEAKAS